MADVQLRAHRGGQLGIVDGAGSVAVELAEELAPVLPAGASQPTGDTVPFGIRGSCEAGTGPARCLAEATVLRMPQCCCSGRAACPCDMNT